MSLLNVIKVSLSFTGKPIFDEIGFQVEHRDRIGLVGPNGSGKTSLLRLIMGVVSPDSGDVRVAKGVRVGYLAQDVQETLSGPLLQSIFDSAPGRVQVIKELEHAEKSLKGMSSKKEQSRLAERLSEIHQKMSLIDLEYPRHSAEKILLGLGFEESDLSLPVSSLSGGWKMRAALASLLFQRPDLLLLDEPTNHLDIPSVHWIEQFLQDFNGAMILVSHDREFLNRQIRRTISFEPEGMRSYSGNYDFYLKAREEESRTLEARAKKQDQRVREAERFIERFRSKASKARQAQSKIKLLEKMELIKTYQREKITHFSFPEVPRSGRVVVSIKGVSKGFDGKSLYENFTMNVLRGERIAIIGPNGSGKTTLLKMVANEMEPDRGEISLGHGVSMGYFAQHHSDMLDNQKTVIEEVYHAVPDATVGFIRGVCGAFLFSGEDVDKAIGVLSGGEKARVSLAKLLVDPGNLMVMDEPTNHLDISSSEALISALSEYNGTLLFVSHNQSFVNRLATKIWDLKENEVVEYPGNLEEYYRDIDSDEDGFADSSAQDKDGAGQMPAKKSQDRKREKRQEAERRQLIYETLKPIRDELERLEVRIDGLETRKGEIEKTLADPDFFSDKNKSVPLLSEYHEAREELDDQLLKWEQNQEKLEAMERKLGVTEE